MAKIYSNRFHKDYEVATVPSSEHPELTIVSRASMCAIKNEWEDSVTIRTEYIPHHPVYTMKGTLEDDSGAVVESYASYDYNNDKNMDVERLYLKLVASLVKTYGQFDVSVYGEDALPEIRFEEKTVASKYVPKPVNKPAPVVTVPSVEDVKNEDYYEEDLPWTEIAETESIAETPVEKPAEKPVVQKNTGIGKPFNPYAGKGKSAVKASEKKTEKPVEKAETNNTSADSEIGNYVVMLKKHKGKTLAEVDSTDHQYLEWVANYVGDNPEILKAQVVVKEYLGVA